MGEFFRGLETAAAHHDRVAIIFRNAVENRNKDGIGGTGEFVWKAEQHESAAQDIRNLMKEMPENPMG